MDKKIFKNSEGEIHVGNNAPEGFSEATIEEVKKTLKNLDGKKLWRCHVCNDLHISKNALETCPTCFYIDAYIEINEKELRGFLKI